ncbi:MAG: TlpA family protein disulfide reductase, partial [Planctomycetes bacterium]|nr:TlpA family protein disulfide reductase [Planctomycetota bacterium]
MRSIPLCLLLLIVFQQVLGPAPLQGAGAWPREQAVKEIDALVVIEQLKQNKPADRMAQVRSWLKKIEATGLDLGEDAYVKAFPLYLVGKKENGSSSRPTSAVECLVGHIIKHGGLPAEAGQKYGGWIDRILPMAIYEALDAKDLGRGKALLPTLALHGGRGAYGAYSSFGSRLVKSEEPVDVKLLTELVAMAMADQSMDAEMKGKLLKYLYSAEPREPRERKGSGAARPSRAAETGDLRFAEFSGKTLDGKEVSVKDFRGKVLLIDFWATWCGPCVREMPNVVSSYEKYKDQGFAILGVTMD